MVSPLLSRIDACYDGIAHVLARAEPHGPLVLFVRDGPGWPLYARPAPTASRPVTAEDIVRVRGRQRELGVPEAVEWVHDVHPEILGAAGQAGLTVLKAPLLALDPAGLPSPAAGPAVRLLDPASATYRADLASCRAVTAVGFAAPGTGTGPAGPVEREAARRPLDRAEVRDEAECTAAGVLTRAVAEVAGEPVGTGVLLRSGEAAEIAGVATLPSARRRGVGAAVTGTLARHALRHGVEVVFLSAGSDEIARVYQRVGFRRIGTACIAEPTGR